MDRSGWDQFTRYEIEKGRSDETSVLMTSFGPGIRIEHIEGLQGSIGQAMFDDERDIGLDEPDVCECVACRLAGHFPDPLGLAFNPDEIRIRMLGGPFEQEAPVAATSVDFERIAVTEDPFSAPGRDDGSRQPEDEIRGEKWRYEAG